MCPEPAGGACPGSAPIALAGDPAGNGAGGPGYSLAAEPVLGDYLLGAVAMYSGDTARIGSTFLISTGDSRSLSRRYVIFGQVTDGITVLASLTAGTKILWVAIEATAPER